jgi:hypothetical protein
MTHEVFRVSNSPYREPDKGQGDRTNAQRRVNGMAETLDELRREVTSLRETAHEQMELAGALASGAFFEGQTYAYDEVLRRLAPRVEPSA